MGQRQCRTAEKKINVLEERARTWVNVGEILSQSLAKEMGSVLKALRDNSSRNLSGGPGVRVLPGEGKEEV